MNKWAELLLGLILVVAAVWIAWMSPVWWGSLWDFKHAAWEFLKGAVFWVIIMIGALFILLGISDMKG